MAAASECRTERGAIDGLKVVGTAVGPVRTVATRGRVTPAYAARISGPCIGEIIAARATQFRLKSGLTVEMTESLSPGRRVPLAIRHGPTTFDDIDVVKVPKGSARSGYGNLQVITTVSKAPGNSRFVGVWVKRHGSMIGYVDYRSNRGAQAIHPLAVIPYKAEIAYFFPAPDTAGGTIAVLAHDSARVRVLWFDVSS
jgi:hypothetical protein